MAYRWFETAFKRAGQTTEKTWSRQSARDALLGINCWFGIADACRGGAAKHTGCSVEPHPSRLRPYGWNPPKVGPFEIRIRYQSVEEPPVRVLVVEDDPLVRELVVEALREEGYEVIHAANGEQALAWCKRRIADVLVTDIKLPGEVDGWQIAELCREHDPGLRVIYATGFSPVEARPVPGSLTLQKPCQPDRIVKAVRQMRREGP